MSDVGVVYVVFVGLLVQEVKHVFDGQWQGAASVGCAEDGLKQIVHKLLQRALRVARSKMDHFKPQKCNEINNLAFTEYGKTYTELKPTKEKKKELRSSSCDLCKFESHGLCDSVAFI